MLRFRKVCKNMLKFANFFICFQKKLGLCKYRFITHVVSSVEFIKYMLDLTKLNCNKLKINDSLILKN